MIGRLEASAADRVEHASVQCVVLECPGLAGHCPLKYLVCDSTRRLSFAPDRREQGVQRPMRPPQQRVIMRGAQLNSLVGQLFHRVPLARDKAIQTEKPERLNRGVDCATLAPLMNEPPQCRAASREAFAVPGSDGNSDDVGRAGLATQVIEGVVKPTERRRCSPCRVCGCFRDEAEELGRAWPQSPERPIERLPELGPATEVADLEQVVHRLVQNVIVGVGRVARCFDRSDENDCEPSRPA